MGMEVLTYSMTNGKSQTFGLQLNSSDVLEVAPDCTQG